MKHYDSDRTVGHREYWKSVFEAVRAEVPEVITPIAFPIATPDVDTMSFEELEKLTVPEVTRDLKLKEEN